MAETSNLPAGLRSATLAEDAASGLGGTLDGAGMALGDLVKQVGMAVADTQRRLNETCASTANALAGTMVDVVAVRHTEYDDEGNVVEGANITMELPLVGFVDPVNYEMSQVHLQGVFQASEFKSAHAGSSGGSHSHGGASLYLGGYGAGPGVAAGLNAAAGAAQGGAAGGYAYGARSSSSAEYGGAYTHQREFGQVRMNAEMVPRNDIGVPKPRHVVRGPTLLVVPQGVASTPAHPTAESPLAERSSVVKVTYRKRPSQADTVGAPIAGASFAVEADGLQWGYCNAAGTVVDDSDVSTFRQTDANGVLYFKVRRVFAPGEDTAPRSFALSARIGLVQSTVPVAL